MVRFRSINTGLIATLAILAVGCGDSGSGGTTTTTDTTGTTAATTGTTAANPTTTADTHKGRPMPTAPGNTASGNTIIIGMVASLNGDQKPWGDDCQKGGLLALDDFNKANPNGIDGKKIDLQVRDDNSDPVQGKSASEKLISDGALAIVGEVASGITAQIENAAFDKGIPVVAVGATRTDITDYGANLFRVCYTDDFQGPVMAKFAFDELGKKKAAIITDQKLPYSTGLSNAFRDYFTKLGGTIVDEEFYNQKETQFSGILTNVKAKQPDVIFASGYFPETGPLARQAREQGIDKNVPILGGDGWDSKEILNTGGDAILGSYFCNHYNNNEKRPEVGAFLERWKAKYGALPGTTMGALGYDGTMVVLNALKNSKTPDSKSIMDQIENTENYPGVSGSITLKGMKGNPHKRALVVRLDKTGQSFVKAYEWGDIYPGQK